MPSFRAGDFGEGLAKFGETLNAQLRNVDRSAQARSPSRGTAATQLASTSSSDSNFAIGKTSDRTQPSVLAAVVGATWVATAIRSQQPVCQQCGKRSGVQFKNTNQTSVLDNSGSVGFAMGSDIAIFDDKSSNSRSAYDSSSSMNDSRNIESNSTRVPWTTNSRRVPWEISRPATWERPGERWKAYHCAACGYSGRHVESIPSGQMEESARVAAAAAAAEARRRRAYSDRGGGGINGGMSGGSSSGGGGGASW